MPTLPGFGTAFLETSRNTILSGFLALPILLITITGFLATATANVGLILLFLGQIFVVPIAQILLSLVRSVSFIQSTFVLDPNLKYEAFPRLSAFSPADVTADMVPPVTSYWIAHLMFFSSYLIMNAIALYTVDTGGCPPGWIDMGLTCQEPITYGKCDKGSTTPNVCSDNQGFCCGALIQSVENKLGGGQRTVRPSTGGSVQSKTFKSVDTGDFKSENRKAHAITALIVTTLTLIAATATYYNISRAETPGSLAIATLVFVPLGVGWFELAKLCGLSVADVFGVASQLNVPSGNSMPYACVNITR